MPNDATQTGTLHFDSHWGETLAGALVATGMLKLEYEPARAQIQHTHNGFPAWGVTAFVKFEPSRELVETPAIVFAAVPVTSSLIRCQPRLH